MAEPAPDNPLKIAVLGAGSWGTALAALMARHGHAVTLWGRDPVVSAAIDQQHENTRYLPGIPLPENLRATTDLAASLADADQVLIVVPSHAFTETLKLVAPLRPASGTPAGLGMTSTALSWRNSKRQTSRPRRRPANAPGFAASPST